MGAYLREGLKKSGVTEDEEEERHWGKKGFQLLQSKAKGREEYLRIRRGEFRGLERRRHSRLWGLPYRLNSVSVQSVSPSGA